ncbi:GNAT family N-acetyltransferase [Sphingorhabdus arenilitoris]|uniref:GNAT family N-acetyltransferase n=1 Tax=Sphingorhabdus arenilitoris TaxID=1490041 RepID=A0ABV8RC07_9SPHN
MPDIIMETDRLILRRFEESDAELQYRYCNSAAVTRHIGGPKELHQIESSHAKSEAAFAQFGFGFMAMQEKASGDFIGYCGAKRVDCAYAKNIGDAEMGWLVREDRWRQGFAVEAARALLMHMFERIGVPHICAMTSESNISSWRLMEKLGMVRRKELDFDDPDYPEEENPTIVYVKENIS